MSDTFDVEPRSLPQMHSFRMSPEDSEFLRWYAEQKGMTRSEVLRYAISLLPRILVRVSTGGAS